MKTYREAIFSGWFGPMGVGAVFLSIIAKEELETAYEGKEAPVSIQIISPVVLFIVFCSVIVHGTTIPLFKLGKRIRTRTLSISSISSNQVLRLPKLQFGQQVHKKDGDHHHYKEQELTELERNTLFNTLQHERNNNTQESNVIAINIHDHEHSHEHDSDSDVAEEDFLPDDSSETINNASHPKVALLDQTYDEDPRRSSAISFDTNQAIRFLEPIKPRIGVGSTSAVSNVDRNEASVSSLRSWLLRQNIRDGEDLSSGEEENQQTTNHSSSIKKLFRRLKDHSHSSNSSPTIEHEAKEKIPPRIGVWEEGHNIVIEDTKDDASEAAVIDKNEYGKNWRKKTREKIKQLEHAIHKDDGKKVNNDNTNNNSRSSSTSPSESSKATSSTL